MGAPEQVVLGVLNNRLDGLRLGPAGAVHLVIDVLCQESSGRRKWNFESTPGLSHRPETSDRMSGYCLLQTRGYSEEYFDGTILGTA